MAETIVAAVEGEARLKRYDVAGRKVLFYIEDMFTGDRISFTFQVKAMYHFKARGVSSEVCSYYKQEFRGETLSEDVIVSGN